MPRITRISGSLAIVLVAYWAYALMAVPWIEPPAAPQPPTESSGNAGPTSRPCPTCKRAEIKPLFRPGDWEVGAEKTKVLESDRAKLLFQRYTQPGRRQGGDQALHDRLLTMARRERGQRHPPIDHAASPRGRHPAVRPRLGPQAAEGSEPAGRAIGRQDRHPQRLEAARPRRRSADRHEEHSTQQAEHFHAGAGRIPLGPAFRQRPGHGDQAPARQVGGEPGWTSAGIASFELRHIERLHLELGPETEKLWRAEKGTGPICRNGPEGAAHKLDLSPLPPPDAGRNRLQRPLPLRRGPPRRHLPRQRPRGESESRRASPMPDRLRRALAILDLSARRSRRAAKRRSGPICSRTARRVLARI